MMNKSIIKHQDVLNNKQDVFWLYYCIPAVFQHYIIIRFGCNVM